MTETADPASVFDEHYFRTYRGAPYERSASWLAVFAATADAILREIKPRTALDAGCAMGFLVEALRDRGVEAYGVDVSPYAIERVREDIKPHCWVGSLLDPLPRRYDVVVCHEVLEHLPADAAPAAVANLCDATDDVLFASTHDDHAEDTHLNVQPPEYWTGLFARRGFVRDVDFDVAVLPAPWAVRFRRREEPWPRLAVGYERRLSRALREIAALRARAVETKSLLAAKDRDLAERPDPGSLEQTVADQQAHLDALSRRLEYMSDRENELRSLLHDAHEQLLDRDELIARGQPGIEDLHKVIAERTAWAERMVSEAEKRLEIIHEQRAAIEALESDRARRLRRSIGSWLRHWKRRLTA